MSIQIVYETEKIYIFVYFTKTQSHNTSYHNICWMT